MDICEVYGIVSCACGKGPIEIVCTEVGKHKCHNFVIPEDELTFIESKEIETKAELIKRLKENLS